MYGIKKVNYFISKMFYIFLCKCIYTMALSLLSRTYISPLIHSPSRALVTLRLSPSLKPSPPDCLHWIQMFLHYRQTERARGSESTLWSNS